MRRIILIPLLLLMAFTWNLGTRTLQQPVEQQTPGGATQPDHSLWVVNPTSCAWDADDRLQTRGLGILNAGESTTWHECVIADGTPHVFAVSSYSPKVGLTVTVTWSNADATRTISVNVPARQTTITCFEGPEYDQTSPLLVPIPDSNGGVGRTTDIAVTATNTTGQRMRDSSVFTELRVASIPCPGPLVREDIIPGQLWWRR
jgi:hypothetical protein